MRDSLILGLGTILIRDFKSLLEITYTVKYII